jgi:hypothetical protein
MEKEVASVPNLPIDIINPVEEAGSVTIDVINPEEKEAASVSIVRVCIKISEFHRQFLTFQR